MDDNIEKRNIEEMEYLEALLQADYEAMLRETDKTLSEYTPMRGAGIVTLCVLALVVLTGAMLYGN